MDGVVHGKCADEYRGQKPQASQQHGSQRDSGSGPDRENDRIDYGVFKPDARSEEIRQRQPGDANRVPVRRGSVELPQGFNQLIHDYRRWGLPDPVNRWQILSRAGRLQETCTTRAALSRTFALKRAASITKRSWRPTDILSMPSCASTWNSSFLPSIFSSRTLIVTVSPGGVAASWEKLTCVPSVCSAGQSRCGRSASMHAHSISPTMKPVASTAGISRNISDSGYRCGTVLVSGT